MNVLGFNLIAILPEAILAAGAMIVLLAGSFMPKARPRVLAVVALAFFAAAGVAAAVSMGEEAIAFEGALALDGFAVFFKLVFIVAAAVTVIASVPFLAKEGGPPPEFFALVMFAAIGMILMASSTDLILIFVALETFSLALYVLAAFRRARLDSQEAALKYFLTGSFSSAFFLYGVALIYGGSGSTRLGPILASFTYGSEATSPLVVAGLALLLVGLAFKVAAVPFHMWTPDAYQGSPAPVAGFMAAGSKAAGFAVLLRMLLTAFPSLIDDWRPIVTGLAVVSMVFGSVVAVAQTNVKRMLAYSAIAHSGFLLIGVIAANDRGVSGTLFYLGSYAFTILGAFGVVYAVGRLGEAKVELDDYRGLGRRQPFLAVIFGLLLVSLAGIPPTAGFWAKFEVFSAAISAKQTPLVVLALLCSAVASFFYLRVIWLMFFDEPADKGAWEGTSSVRAATAPAVASVLVLASAVTLLLGVWPTPLLLLARSATLLP